MTFAFPNVLGWVSLRRKAAPTHTRAQPAQNHARARERRPRIESLEGRCLMAVDPVVAAYQARATQVLQANVSSLKNWASAQTGTDNLATSGLSEWTAAAGFAQSGTDPAAVSAGYLLMANLMEYRTTHLFGGGNDGWEAWATADTYVRYRSVIQAAPGRYAPSGYATNTASGDGKYSLDELCKIVLTQSYYAPIDSTSNHYLMNATACFLANQAFPGQVVKNFNNSTSDPIGAVHLYSRAYGIAQGGPGEFLSINYGGANWYEFLSLSQLTTSPTYTYLANASRLAFETTLAMYAGFWMNGQVAGPTGRGYPNTGAWGASDGDAPTWVYFGGDYGQAAQQLAYATDTNVKVFAVLASEASLSLTHTGAPAPYTPPTNILALYNPATPIVTQTNFNGDYQYAYNNGLWSTYSDGYNFNASGGAAWRNRTIWTKPESQTYNAVAWAINPGTSATADANGNWTYVNPDTLQTYPLSGSGTYGGGSPFSAQVQNQGTTLQGFNIPPRSAGITPGGSYVVRGALIYLPVPKVTATGQEAADGDGWIKPVLSPDGYRLYVAYNSVFMCFLSTAPISLGTRQGFMQFYNVYGGAAPGQTVDPETYLQFAIAQETYSPSDFPGTTLAEQFANFRNVLQARPLPQTLSADRDHPSWRYSDEKVTLTTTYGSPARYARDPETYTRGFGDDFIAGPGNTNPRLIDYSSWPLFRITDAAGNVRASLPDGGNLTVTTPGYLPTYYDYNNWTTSSGPDLGLSISSPMGGQFTLAWKPGLGASSFKIERSSDAVSWTTLTSSLSASATSYTDSNLTQQALYFYRLTPNGTSLGTSFPISAYVTYKAPTNLALTLNSTSQITLTWTNNAASNDGVQLQYSVDGYSQWSWLVNLPASYTSRTVTYTDFTGGERLFYRALAYSNNLPNAAYLYSPPSNIVGTQFSSQYVGGTVSMPRSLNATSTSPAQISLAWTPTAANATSQRLERSLDGVNWTILASNLAASASTYTDSSVTSGVTYYYRVASAAGALLSAYSAIVTAAAALPNQAPTIQTAATAQATGATTVSLSVLGKDDASEPALRYYWKVTSGPGFATFSATSSNAAKNCLATFSRAGTYTLTATALDAQGLYANSSVTFTISQSATTITLTPPATTISTNSSLQLFATALDQFGFPMSTQPTFSWATTAGSISPSGLLTAPANTSLAVVSASVGSSLGVARINVLSVPAPLAEYRFEDGSGSTVRDSSSNHFDGAIVSSAAFSTGITFQGAPTGGLTPNTGSVSLGQPAALNFTGAITLSAWVKFASSSGTQSIIEHGYTQNPNAEVFLRLNSGQYQVGSWNGGNNYTAAAIGTNDYNSWVFLTGVYDSTQSKWLLYKNGSLISSATATGSILVNANWAIGATSGNARNFTGSIDEVRISNLALTPAQVSSLYAHYNGPGFAQAATVTSTGSLAASLFCLGSDDAGESQLKYKWSVIGNTPTTPSGTGTVTFSANDSNAAKSVSATFSQPGTYHLLVTATDVGGNSAASFVDVIATTPPPALQPLLVNDGSAQRSMVKSLTVNFSTPVSLTGNALTLLKQGTTAFTGTLTISPASGYATRFVLTFTGTGVVGGSLPDGVYNLQLDANSIRDAYGQPLSGTPTQTQTFTRLFGDANGDGSISTLEQSAFTAAYARNASQPGYLWYFDYDNNGAINNTDLLQFRKRLALSVWSL